MTMNKLEQDLYNSWSKMDIYKAYLREHDTVQEQKKEISTLHNQLAFIRFSLKKVDDFIKQLKKHLNIQ